MCAMMDNRKAMILDTVKSYSSEHGYPPTIREVRDLIGVTSVSYTHRLVRQLIDEGRLQATEGPAVTAARTLRVIEDG